MAAKRPEMTFKYLYYGSIILQVNRKQGFGHCSITSGWIYLGFEFKLSMLSEHFF